MPYAIQPGEETPAAVRRIAHEQLAAALAELDAEDRLLADRVHEVRKHCKRLRGLLRLVRPGLEAVYGRENHALRDAARELSGVRDAHALEETFDRLLAALPATSRGQQCSAIRGKLVAQRELACRAAAERLPRARDQLAAVQSRVDQWPVRGKRFKAIGGGLERTYGKARRRMRAAARAPDSDAFHEWRKQLKDHWYHLRLLAPFAPDALAPVIERVHYLADLLGEDHDLAELVHWAEHPDAALDPQPLRILKELALARSERLRAEALGLGEALLAESPAALRKRLRQYYRGA